MQRARHLDQKPPSLQKQALLPRDESDLGKVLPRLPQAGESNRDQLGLGASDLPAPAATTTGRMGDL